MMALLDISQKSVQDIAQEMRRTFDPPSAGGRPFPGSSPRTGAVEAWLDLRRETDAPARDKLDEAIQQALINVLADSSAHPETVCGHLRLLRLASQENPDSWRLSDDARNAILTTIRSARFKNVKTSYGDAHAELLACVETLSLAPDFVFWRVQMTDPSYVTNAVSGCLGSGNDHCALSGILQAVKFRDRSLALALMRLFRIFHGRESLVWARFAEARRNELWSEEDYDLVRRAMAQLGQSCPDDVALQIEQEIASLRCQLSTESHLRAAAEQEAKRAAQQYSAQPTALRNQTDAADTHSKHTETLMLNIETTTPPYSASWGKPPAANKQRIDSEKQTRKRDDEAEPRVSNR